MVFIKESKGVLGFLTSGSKPELLVGDGDNWKFLFCVVAGAGGRRAAHLLHSPKRRGRTHVLGTQTTQQRITLGQHDYITLSEEIGGFFLIETISSEMLKDLPRKVGLVGLSVIFRGV